MNQFRYAGACKKFRRRALITKLASSVNTFSGNLPTSVSDSGFDSFRGSGSCYSNKTYPYSGCSQKPSVNTLASNRIRVFRLNQGSRAISKMTGSETFLPTFVVRDHYTSPLIYFLLFRKSSTSLQTILPAVHNYLPTVTCVALFSYTGKKKRKI